MRLGRTLILLLVSGVGALLGGITVFLLLLSSPMFDGSGKGGLGTVCFLTAIAAAVAGSIPGYFCVRFFGKN